MSLVMSFWTPENIEQLKILHQDGLSASQICNKLGAPSRNSVISKLHRLGIKDTDRVVHPSRSSAFLGPRPARPRTFRQARPERKTPFRMLDQGPPVAEVVAMTGPTKQSRSVLITDLVARECRWPVSAGDDLHLFCGAPSRGVYCASHLRASRR